MKTKSGLQAMVGVGLVALLLTGGQALAQEQSQSEPSAEQPAETMAPVALPEEVTSLLGDQRPLVELADKELRQRARRAQTALDTMELPQEVRDQLVAVVSAAQAELKSRKEAEQAKAAQEQAPAEAPAAEPAQPALAEAAPVEAATPVTIPEEVQQLLADQLAVSEFSDEELKSRFRQARDIFRNEALPQEIRDQAQQISRQARAELVAREKAPAAQPKPADPAAVEQPAQQAEEQPEKPAADAPASTEQAIVEQPPAAETPAEAPAAAQAAPAVDKQEAKELDGNKADPEAEAAAKAFLADETPAEQLSDDDLRKRLESMRELMAGNELSRTSERALRQKLKADREVLRQRVQVAEAAAQQKAIEEAARKATAEQQAAAEAGQKSSQPAAQATPGKPKRNINIDLTLNLDTPPQVVLRDRRQSDELGEIELRRRIQVFRDVERDRTVAADDIEFYRDTLRRDRETLRRRMLDDRRRRNAELINEQEDEIVLDDSEIVVPARRKRDVFVAEVEDEELEEVLLAPPARKPKRRLTIDQAAFEPEVRKSIPRIEVDTIRFGFNESFVREEEVGNLDRVAEVIEKILRKYPREVFLIEGHTDAVGSDAYNSKLSKARAEAVKRALTEYYIIPAKNLQTVGLGERFLKIPTAEAEAENRRVSISRATALIGEVD